MAAANLVSAANLALSFAVELIGVGAFGYWGWQTGGAGLGRIVLVIGAPAALIVVWAMVVAPNANNALAQPQRDIIGSALLVAAGVALAAAGQPTAAAVFGAVVLLNWVLLIVFGQDAAAAIRSASGQRPGDPAGRT